jgi:hypothetical protein
MHLPRRLSISPSRHATLRPLLHWFHAAWAENGSAGSAGISPASNTNQRATVLTAAQQGMCSAMSA